MDGLIIKRKWLDKILSGEKTLEIRGSRTKKTGGQIYLLESKTRKVKGKCQISECILIENEEMWEKLKPHHCVGISYRELLEIYKNPYAWVIKDVEVIPDNLYYEHPKGAVIWVKQVKIFQK